VGLVAVVKRLGVASRLLPFTAVLLGISGVFLFDYNPKWLEGVVLGLSAVGLYAGTKSTVVN
jgi:hypothetical protein